MALLLGQSRLNDLLLQQSGGTETVLQSPMAVLPAKKLNRLYSRVVDQNGIAKDHAAKRLQQARSFLANRGFRDVIGPLSRDDAQGVLEFLAGQSEFEPVVALCQAHCATTANSCELAAVQTVGSGLMIDERQVPPHEILTIQSFAASRRGTTLVLQAILQPVSFRLAVQKTLPAITKTDACFANLLQQALPDNLR